MHNFMRSIDRQRSRYPQLKYPGIYLLRGGYFQFNKEFRPFCSKASQVHLQIKHKKKDEFLTTTPISKIVLKNGTKYSNYYKRNKQPVSDYFKEIQQTLYQTDTQTQDKKSVCDNAESILKKYKHKTYFIPGVLKTKDESDRREILGVSGGMNKKIPVYEPLNFGTTNSKNFASKATKTSKRTYKNPKTKQTRKPVPKRNSTFSKSVTVPVTKASQRCFQKYK